MNTVGQTSFADTRLKHGSKISQQTMKRDTTPDYKTLSQFYLTSNHTLISNRRQDNTQRIAGDIVLNRII